MSRLGYIRLLLLAFYAASSMGCGTTRMTDTQRCATEMLLVSQAVDQAVLQFDFSNLKGKPVFLDTQYLDGTVDRGYVISSLRQHLLNQGAYLQEDRKIAAIVVEARSGGVGTDRHSLLVGTPQMSLPAVLPGQPTQIPEVALLKKTDQRGVAKLAVFAYQRETGKAVWESGLVEAKSNLKDTWLFGAGPFSTGTIRKRTELAGEPLPRLTSAFENTPEPALKTGTPIVEASAEALPVGPPPVQPKAPVAPISTGPRAPAPGMLPATVR